MDEAEWLVCSDPSPMVLFLGNRLSHRKLRLFGCACLRVVWEYLPEDALRQAIETCERFADGLATAEELQQARELAHNTYQGIGDIIADHSAIAVEGLCWPKPWVPMEGNRGVISAVVPEAWLDRKTPWDVAWAKAKQAQCDLLRDLFPAGTLDPHRLAVLADALLDAGCTDPEILGHLREPGPHWRGCYILDLLLGKS